MNSSFKNHCLQVVSSYCDFSSDYPHASSNHSLEVTTTDKSLSHMTIMNTTNMSHSAVSIVCICAMSLLLLLLCTNNTVKFTHLGAVTFFGYSKTVCNSSYHEEDSGTKRQMLILFANSSSKDAISTWTANFKQTSSKIWPLYPGKEILETSITEMPLCMSTHSLTIWGEYKVVWIWPGLFVCKFGDISPGHIWTILYYPTFNYTSVMVQIRLRTGELQIFTKHLLL